MQTETFSAKNNFIEAQKADAERLAEKLNTLLVKYGDTLKDEGLRQQVEMLEVWADCYRQGLSAADQLSQNGELWLAKLCDRLKLAADELHRLEDEGGTLPTKEQSNKAENLIGATRQVERLAPEIHHLSNSADSEATTGIDQDNSGHTTKEQ